MLGKDIDSEADAPAYFQRSTRRGSQTSDIVERVGHICDDVGASLEQCFTGRVKTTSRVVRWKSRVSNSLSSLAIDRLTFEFGIASARAAPELLSEATFSKTRRELRSSTSLCPTFLNRVSTQWVKLLSAPAI